MSRVDAACVALLLVTFIASLTLKVLHPIESVRDVVAHLAIVGAPREVGAPLLRLILLTESGAIALLLVSRDLVGFSYVLLVSLSVYTAVLLVVAWQVGFRVGCGCMGPDLELPVGWALVRNGVLMAMCVRLLATERSTRSSGTSA